MGKLITDEGIIIESSYDTLHISGVPDNEEYRFAIFSIKYKWEECSFPAGTWKEVEDGGTSYCLKDRGEGEHFIFISFAPRKEAQPEYTIKYMYGVYIANDNQITFPN